MESVLEKNEVERHRYGQNGQSVVDYQGLSGMSL